MKTTPKSVRINQEGSGSYKSNTGNPLQLPTKQNSGTLPRNPSPYNQKTPPSRIRSVSQDHIAGRTLVRHEGILNSNAENYSEPLTSSPEEWGVEDVIAFIESIDLNFTKWAESFRDHEITGDAFLELTEENLKKDMKIKIGPTKRILKALVRLRAQNQEFKSKRLRSTTNESKRDLTPTRTNPLSSSTSSEEQKHESGSYMSALSPRNSGGGGGGGSGGSGGSGSGSGGGGNVSGGGGLKEKIFHPLKQKTYNTINALPLPTSSNTSPKPLSPSSSLSDLNSEDKDTPPISPGVSPRIPSSPSNNTPNSSMSKSPSIKTSSSHLNSNTRQHLSELNKQIEEREKELKALLDSVEEQHKNAREASKMEEKVIEILEQVLQQIENETKEQNNNLNSNQEQFQYFTDLLKDFEKSLKLKNEKKSSKKKDTSSSSTSSNDKNDEGDNDDADFETKIKKQRAQSISIRKQFEEVENEIQQSAQLAVQKTKNQFMKLKVVDEIVETETEYVQDLAIVINVFLQPLRDKNIISKSEIQTIFCNIEELYNLHSTLLTQLEDVVSSDDPLIGDVFLDNADILMKGYTPYLSNYERVLPTIQQLKADNQQFSQFLKVAESAPQCRYLDVVSFLIKPVQRICKYPTLLKELLKYCPSGSDDFRSVEFAFKTLEDVTNDLNELKRFSENLQKMFLIQASLVGIQDLEFITPSRTFMLQANLTMIMNGNSRDRVVFLFNDLIVYAKPAHNNMYHYRGCFLLSSLSIRDLIDGEHKYGFAKRGIQVKNGFEVTEKGAKEKVFVLVYTSPEQKRIWFEKMIELISKCQNVFEPNAPKLRTLKQSNANASSLME